MEKMAKNGMNIARLNFSHNNYDYHKSVINHVRYINRTKNSNIAILQDLQGPKIRVGDLDNVGIEIDKGTKVALLSERLYKFKKKIKNYVVAPIQYQNLYRDVSKGNIILIEDGTIQLRVERVEKEIIKCVSDEKGIIKGFKGINVPNVSLDVDAITEKDKKDLQFGLKQGVDYVALSFVKSKNDIIKLRGLINRFKSKKSFPKIIAKIETTDAITNFDEILKHVDGIMIARGDLGLETSAASLPVLQKNIILKCLAVAKPVIVATHMLDSMTRNLHPTRAEVSDVANAVIDHTDAVMLSGETAVGKYPIESVKMMSQILSNVEESVYDDFYGGICLEKENISDHIALAATNLAISMEAKAIIMLDIDDRSIIGIARYRPEIFLLALVTDSKLKAQLALYWGVTAVEVGEYKDVKKYINKGLQIIAKHLKLKKGDKLVFVSGDKKNMNPLNAIKVITI